MTKTSETKRTKAADVPEANLPLAKVKTEASVIVKTVLNEFKDAEKTKAIADRAHLERAIELGEKLAEAKSIFKVNGYSYSCTDKSDFGKWAADFVGQSIKSIELYLRVFKFKDVLGNAVSLSDARDITYGKPGQVDQKQKGSNEDQGKRERLTDAERIAKKITPELGKLKKTKANRAKIESILSELFSKVDA